jgi:maltose O-acetyltransferase
LDGWRLLTGWLEGGDAKTSEQESCSLLSTALRSLAFSPPSLCLTVSAIMSADAPASATNGAPLTEWQKMVTGQLYNAQDPEIQAIQLAGAEWSVRYNAALTMPTPDRLVMLKERMGSCGEGVWVRPPLYFDFGTNLHLGSNVAINFGCVALDVCPIRIGDRTLIGSNVQLLAADHPRDVATRSSGVEGGKPITIGADVWIGSGAIILPGVSVGEGAIVGAGAVVSRDVPAGCTVAGNPARVVNDKHAEANIKASQEYTAKAAAAAAAAAKQ